MTDKSPRSGKTMRALVLCLLILFMVLPAVMAWAVESGDQVVGQCKANPFDKSQMTKAKIYAEPSIYSQVVTESCGEKLTVLEAADGWVKVQDREKNYAGYLNEKDIAKIISGSKGAAKTTRTSEAAETSKPLSAKPTPKAAKKPPVEPTAASTPKSEENPFTLDSKGQMPPSSSSRPEQPARAEASPTKTQQLPDAESEKLRYDQGKAGEGIHPAVAPEKAAPLDLGRKGTGDAVRAPTSGKGCARIFLKMSQGKLLSQQEQNYLRRHCQ